MLLEDGCFNSYEVEEGNFSCSAKFHFSFFSVFHFFVLIRVWGIISAAGPVSPSIFQQLGGDQISQWFVWSNPNAASIQPKTLHFDRTLHC